MHIHTCIYLYMYVCKYIYIYIYIYICICICMYTCILHMCVSMLRLPVPQRTRLQGQPGLGFRVKFRV